MEAEGSEMIDSQKCVGKLETLEEMGKLCIIILREAVRGQIKFSEVSWKAFCEYVKECRVYEVISGLERAVGHVICTNHRNFGWKKEEIHFDVLKLYFESGIHGMILSMIDLLLDEHQQEELNSRISLFDPSKGNDKGFLDGRLEQLEINDHNMQVIAIGGYFAIRTNKVPEKFKYDSRLKSRCTKLSGIHELAALGKAVLTMGIAGAKYEAILPSPPKRLNQTPKDERKRTEPISVTMKL